ncbi:hypothetical protein BI308_00850 [Roseofilum reptotaenium AO1-A]|uniref:Uncharacterized protein n=1 Tax=Roseofilum reptotaenium AO1-A TaxID=1925591 RepID=A0A1L9QXY6_9CYAN|nr:hypothetical protein BI308_00850 [Roseofilum reptotaenium AO1-A]
MDQRLPSAQARSQLKHQYYLAILAHSCEKNVKIIKSLLRSQRQKKAIIDENSLLISIDSLLLSSKKIDYFNLNNYDAGNGEV